MTREEKRIAIFPWIFLKKTVSIGNLFELRPVSLNDELPEATQECFNSFEIMPKVKIINATVVVPKNAPLTSVTNSQSIDILFRLRYAFALEMLLARNFFSNEYWNSDSLQLIVHPVPPNGIISWQVRRRDGQTTIAAAREQASLLRPSHAPLVYVDLPTDSALRIHKVFEDLEDPNFYDAIRLFVESNTDSPHTRREIELVMTVSALEQLFESRLGNEDDFVKKGTDLFAKCVFKNEEINTTLQIHNQHWPNARSMEEIWLRDIFRSRGDAAHGKHSSSKKRKGTWDIDSHLLLAAHFFPRLALMKIYYDHQILDESLFYFFRNLRTPLQLLNPFSKSKNGEFEWARLMR